VRSALFVFLTISIILCVMLFISGMRVYANTVVPGITYKDEPGPYTVAIQYDDWRDQVRQRTVPVKIYAPQTGHGPFPVIIFSHGLGGSRDGYAYLGQHWASYGYVVVHVQHAGSDAVMVKANPSKAALQWAMVDPRNAINRPKDVSFVIDQLSRLERDDPRWKRKVDMGNIGVAGHSFGGYTALAVAGLRFPGGQTLGDPRVKAAIAMSSPANTVRNTAEQAYGAITIPILHMTGTLDDSPISNTKAADRRIPFDHIVCPEQYLVTFAGGDHMIFSGRERLWNTVLDHQVHTLILQSTTAFWDAFLKHSVAARVWLADGDFTAVLGKAGTWEVKKGK